MSDEPKKPERFSPVDIALNVTCLQRSDRKVSQISAQMLIQLDDDLAEANVIIKQLRSDLTKINAHALNAWAVCEKLEADLKAAQESNAALLYAMLTTNEVVT